MWVAGLVFSLYTCQPQSIGFAESSWVRASSWWHRLLRESPCQTFFDEAVYPTGKSRQLVCQPNKLAALLPPDTRALLLHLSTDSNRYSGTTIIRDQHAVRKLTLTWCITVSDSICENRTLFVNFGLYSWRIWTLFMKNWTIKMEESTTGSKKEGKTA